MYRTKDGRTVDEWLLLSKHELRKKEPLPWVLLRHVCHTLVKMHLAWSRMVFFRARERADRSRDIPVRRTWIGGFPQFLTPT